MTETYYHLYPTFKEHCLQIFTFLITDYGCGSPSYEESGMHFATVTYRNTTTGVEIYFEPRENYIYIKLIQLINGEVPDYLWHADHWAHLGLLLRFRRSTLSISRKEWGDWMDAKDIGVILQQYAVALRTYAADILVGDFSVFTAFHARYPPENLGASLGLDPPQTDDPASSADDRPHRR